jgi:hypothetical protein
VKRAEKRDTMGHIPCINGSGNIDSFYRNDIASNVWVSSLPFFYTLIIVVPFIQYFANKIFSRVTDTMGDGCEYNESVNIIFFHVSKDTQNPFKDDIYQVAMRDHENESLISSVESFDKTMDVIEYLNKYDGLVYMIYNGNKVQELSFRRLIRGYKNSFLIDKIRFVDIKTLYMHTYVKSSIIPLAKLKVSSILRTMNIVNKHSNVCNFQSIYNKLRIRDMSMTYSDIWE